MKCYGNEAVSPVNEIDRGRAGGQAGGRYMREGGRVCGRADGYRREGGRV